MIGLFVVFFIFAVILPAMSGASQDETDPDRVKILVNQDAVYHFQEITDLKDSDDDGSSAEERLTSTVEDHMRLYTKRMWYSYGMDRPVPRPLVGYFPYVGTEEAYNAERSAGKSHNGAHQSVFNGWDDRGRNFRNEFQNNIHPKRHGDYFSHRLSKSKPDIYISKITTPRLAGTSRPGDGFSSIEDVTGLECTTSRLSAHPDDPTSRIGGINTDLDIIDNSKIVELRHWEKSVVTVRHWGINPESSKFEEFIEDEIEPFLHLNEQFIDEGGASAFTKKRYYDHSFRLLALNNKTSIESKYNGSWAMGFERTMASTPLRRHSLAPNLYIIGLSLEDYMQDDLYYDLISLGGNIPGFAEEYPYWSHLVMGTQIVGAAYKHLFEPFRYEEASTFPYIRNWINGMASSNKEGLDLLADKFRNLAFSNLDKEFYNAVTKDAVPEGLDQWLPMYVRVNFIPGIDRFYKVYNNLGFFRQCFTDDVAHYTSDTAAGKSLLDPYVVLAHDIHSISPTQTSFMQVESEELPTFTRARDDHNTSYRGYGVQRNSDRNSTAMKLDDETALTNKITNVWDIQDWFKLYCVGNEIDFTRDDVPDGLRFFYEPHQGAPDADTGERQQYPGLTACTWEKFLEAHPEIEIWFDESDIEIDMDKLATKPVPLATMQAWNDAGTAAQSTILDLTEPIRTPTGEEWYNCGGNRVFREALQNIYNNIDTKLEDQKFRDYRDIMNGKLAYSEPVFYRIEKRDKATGEVIQNFILPYDLIAATSDDIASGFSYIDAQIAYGLEYDYAIYGYHMVLGNEYWYETAGTLVEQRVQAVYQAEQDAITAAEEWRVEQVEEVLGEFGNFYAQDGSPMLSSTGNPVSPYRDRFDLDGVPNNFFDTDGQYHVVRDCGSTSMMAPMAYNAVGATSRAGAQLTQWQYRRDALDESYPHPAAPGVLIRGRQQNHYFTPLGDGCPDPPHYDDVEHGAENGSRFMDVNGNLHLFPGADCDGLQKFEFIGEFEEYVLSGWQDGEFGKYIMIADENRENLADKIFAEVGSESSPPSRASPQRPSTGSRPS